MKIRIINEIKESMHKHIKELQGNTNDQLNEIRKLAKLK
jgi:hypothetical protein